MPAPSWITRIITSAISRPPTRLYPFETRPEIAGSRGKIEIEIDKCIFCGICQKRCPCQAISVGREAKTWEINRLRCIQCGACVEPCPKKCLALNPERPASSATKDIDSFTQRPKTEAPAA